MNETRAKALKLLDALAAEHEPPCEQADHEWRECRTCLAAELVATQSGKRLLRILLEELWLC